MVEYVAFATSLMPQLLDLLPGSESEPESEPESDPESDFHDSHDCELKLVEISSDENSTNSNTSSNSTALSSITQTSSSSPLSVPVSAPISFSTPVPVPVPPSPFASPFTSHKPFGQTLDTLSTSLLPPPISLIPRKRLDTTFPSLLRSTLTALMSIPETSPSSYSSALRAFDSEALVSGFSPTISAGE